VPQSYNCYEVKFIGHNHNVKDSFVGAFKGSEANNCVSLALTCQILKIVPANVLRIKA
jgi:hypothetical protein